jgi:polar amino acid transport system substrate-binding protein
MKRHVLKVALVCAMTVLSATAFAGGSAEPATPINSAADLKGKRIAVKTGTVFDSIVEQKIPGSSVLYFTGSTDCALAVMAGKADAMLDDQPVCEKIVALHPELRMLLPPLVEDAYGLIATQGSPHVAELNQFYKDAVASGLYDEMINRWIRTADTPKMPEISFTGTKGTINVVTDGLSDPFTYYGVNNELAGFSVEYMNRFAAEYGYSINWEAMDCAGLLASVQSGKADIGASSLSITEERKKVMDFSDPYYTGGFTLVVRK